MQAQISNQSFRSISPSTLPFSKLAPFLSAHEEVVQSEKCKRSHPIHSTSDHRHQKRQRLQCRLPAIPGTATMPEPDSSPSNPLFTGPNPTILLAGFYLEELPAVRQLLDVAGGESITLIPCMPWLLDLSLSSVIADVGEPEWEQPMPDTWVHGGGWSQQQRVALFQDLSSMAQGTIMTMLESSPVGEDLTGAAIVSADFGGSTLKEVLGRAVKKKVDKCAVAVKLDFVDSVEALPSLESLETLILGGDSGVSPTLNIEEEKEEGEEEDDTFVDDDLLIDKIAAELMQ